MMSLKGQRHWLVGNRPAATTCGYLLVRVSMSVQSQNDSEQRCLTAVVAARSTPFVCTLGSRNSAIPCCNAAAVYAQQVSQKLAPILRRISTVVSPPVLCFDAGERYQRLALGLSLADPGGLPWLFCQAIQGEGARNTGTSPKWSSARPESTWRANALGKT